MFKEFLKDIFNKDNIKGYFYRNKKLIIIAVLIFILSFIIGVLFWDLFRDYIIEALKHIAEDISDNPSTETKNIYFNNLEIAFVIILSGLFLSIFTVIILFLNGLVIGFVYSIAPIGMSLLYTLPHGIFEIPGILLAVVCSFLMTKLEINILKGILQNGKTFRGQLNNSIVIIKDIILSIVMIIVLLSIAAVIEGFVTLPLAEFIMSLV